jgi:uncharacterized damage-inducible protein DinB
MTEKTFVDYMRETVLVSLEETFESVKGIYLDRGTSIFETLATISAEEASIPSASSCASIAAHVEHMTYYMDIILQFAQGERPETNWKYIWNTVEAVTPAEWTASQKKLRESYHRVQELANNSDWDNEDVIQGAVGMLMHNAYHLGEIRQMLCHIKAQ